MSAAAGQSAPPAEPSRRPGQSIPIAVPDLVEQIAAFAGQGLQYLVIASITGTVRGPK
jgi:hypothetical protein